MNDKLFIPKKCKVGFNTRSDTYTGKLGYIIMFDGKIWRKEPSWLNWIETYISEEEFQEKKLESFNYRLAQETKNYQGYLENKDSWGYRNNIIDRKLDTLDKYLKLYNLDSIENYPFNIPHKISDITINPVEFDNIPTEGFVLNKKVGGDRYFWNPRQTYSRVYDPRGWEFEISIPNLLFILECTNSIKGKGLEGEFVYSWSGKDLVLLPCESENYKSSIKHTELQDKKVSTKDLKEGYTYVNSKGNNLIYLGKLPIVKEVKDGEETYIKKDYYFGNRKHVRTKYKSVIVNTFVFYNNNPKYTWDVRYKYEKLTSISSIKSEVSNAIPENFAELVENYYKLFTTKLSHE